MLCPKSFSTPGDLKGHYYKHTGTYNTKKHSIESNRKTKNENLMIIDG